MRQQRVSGGARRHGMLQIGPPRRPLPVRLGAMRAALLALCLLAGATAALPALAQPPDGRAREAHPHRERVAPAPWRRPMDPEERRRLREDLAAPPARVAPAPAQEERWREAHRLREEVRNGRLTREEAMRAYRERFGAHPGGRHGRLAPEEREQLRRDVLEASRDLERR